MRVWVLKLGRLALARTRYDAIGGWRRLWWRFWWWEGQRPPKRINALPTRSPEPRGPLHFSCDGRGLPYCGAISRGARWTVEPSAVECEECKLLALPLIIQQRCNTR